MDDITNNDINIDEHQEAFNETYKKKKKGGFQAYNLSKFIYKAILAKGYKLPTPIQRKCIPAIMEGNNIVAMARTGSGKTAAFLIPAIEKLKCHSQIVGVRCIVISPTREIAVQTAKFFKEFTKFTDLRFALLVGGNEFESQFEKLAQNPDVIIATPGRLMHHIDEIGLSLSTVEMIIYDEADRIFEMGFAEQIFKITDKLPRHRQSLLFSATIPDSLASFTMSGIKDYKLIRLNREYTLSDQLKLHFFLTRSSDKAAGLMYILRERIASDELTLIFAATKYHVEYLGALLSTAGINSSMIYGAMDQEQRDSAISLFRKKQTPILIVTDLAARGIDIPMLNNVIHYDFPPSMKLFIHRSGRTARAGNSGTCYCLLNMNEAPFLIETSLFVGRKFINDVSSLSASEKEEAFNDPAITLYGTLSQQAIDMYNEEVKMAYEKNIALEDMEKPMKNSMIKYNKHKTPASGHSVSKVKELGHIGVHPLVLRSGIKSIVNEDALLEIKQYKPKMNAIECMYTRKKQTDELENFQKILSNFDSHYESHKNRIENKKQNDKLDIEDLEEVKKKVKEAKMKAKLTKKSEKYHTEVDSKKRISKRDRKIMKKMSKEEQKQYLETLKAVNPAEKRQKLTETTEIASKKSEFYIKNERDEKAENLWGKDEKFNMEDLNLNLLPDDEKSMLKQKREMKWDKKKKKYVQMVVGSDGSAAKPKNESGKRINFRKDKDPALYKKWVRKTHLKIQDTGEREDKKTVESAMNYHRKRYEDRSEGKKPGRGRQSSKGQVRNFDQLTKMKKKKRLEIEKRSRHKRDPNSASSISFHKKIQSKIEARSRPTKSMIVIKNRSKSKRR